jgi:lysozyme
MNKQPMKATGMSAMKYRKSIAALAAVVAIGGSYFSRGLVDDIVTREGVELKAYRPLPTDRPTIAAGSTFNPDGTPVKMGQVISRAQVDAYIRYDHGRFSKSMQKCITAPLYENEYRAVYSWMMNVGETAGCKSTLVKKLNRYDYAGACAELKKWNIFQGKPNKGLTNRREAEYKQCMGME